jgi:hypothetical protein
MALSKKQTDDLEGLVDRTSLAEVLFALGEICFGKAEHLETNWQDRNAAKAWERAGKRLDSVTVAVDRIGLP